jgi:nucleosome assembly protein 1-like 1
MNDMHRLATTDAVPEGTAEPKGIPGFWLQCLANVDQIGEILGEEDVAALEALTDVTVDYSEDYATFTISFHFAENEFFTNSVLTKTYTVEPDLFDDNPTLIKSEGSTIDWKPSKDLTVHEIKKKQKAKSGKNKGQVRPVLCVVIRWNGASGRAIRYTVISSVSH